MPISLPTYSARINPVATSGQALVEHPEYLTANYNDKTGQILQKAASEANAIFTEYATKKENARKEVEAVNLNTAVMNMEDEWKNSIANRTDYINFESEYNDKSKQALDTLKGMVQNPEDWAVYEPKIKQKIMHLGIQTRIEADKKMYDSWAVNFQTNTLPAYEKKYIETGDTQYVDELKGIAESLESVGALNKGSTVQVIKTMGKAGDKIRLDKIMSTDVDEAERMLIDPAKNFPYLSEGDVLTAEGRIDRQRNTNEQQAIKAKKEVYSANAVQVKKGFRDWSVGKNPKFEQQLEDAYAKDQISDGLYSTMSDKVFNKKESWGNKMTEGKWKAYSTIETELLKDNSSIENLDDLYSNKDFRSLPDSKQERLAGILGKNIPVKNAIKTGMKIINDSFSMTGTIDPIEKDNVRTLFMDSI